MDEEMRELLDDIGIEEAELDVPETEGEQPAEQSVDVTKLHPIEPSNKRDMADIEKEVVTDDGSVLSVTVRKRIQCPDCGYVVNEPLEKSFVATCQECRHRFDEPDVEGDAAEIYEWIQNYIAEEDRRPTKSKCVQDGPFDSTKTLPLLEELVEREILTTDQDRRIGNMMTVYEPV